MHNSLTLLFFYSNLLKQAIAHTQNNIQNNILLIQNNIQGIKKLM